MNKKKYLYWQSENSNYLILIRDWKTKELIRTEFNFKFEKKKTDKKPSWFNDEAYGYVLNKNALKNKIIEPMPRFVFNKDRIIDYYRFGLIETPKNFVMTNSATS